MLHKLKKNLYVTIIISAILYLALVLYADHSLFLESISHFSIYYIILLLTLSYLNYLSRFVKWNYYLRILGIKISRKLSFHIFMSGLVMSVTPGKVGELLKSYMLKQTCSQSISKTAPIVLAERMTDLLSLLLLTIIGSIIFQYQVIITVIISVLFLLLTFALTSKSIHKFIIKIFSRRKSVNKYVENLSEASVSISTLLKIKPLVGMTLFSFLAWFFECFGFYLILIKFETEISLFAASFFYSFSTIIGSISMMPGGLGTTEGSLTYLLIIYGFPINEAAASTFLIRVVTLWFAVLVGMISVIIFQKRYGKITYD